MYSTSQDYKDAMRSASRPYDTVEGTISLTNGTVVTVDGSNMPSNSISISKQCIDNDELMFGGVFASTLKLSILPPDGVSRYDLFGATIELSYYIQTGTENDEPVFEEVPLGIYTVADADKPSDRVILTAYDNMLMLDVKLGGLYLTGTVWQMFELISQNTGIELGFTEQDLSNFINTADRYQLSASEDRGIQTYRDVVKEICQQLGCFAVADRQGKLNLKAFSQRPDIALTMSDWYSFVPADYKCKYIGLSLTSLAGTFTKIDETAGQGLIMVIEDAPAWDYGSQENLEERTTNLFGYLTQIDEYTPGQLDMPGDPSFDCGDRLQLTARNGDVIETLITSMEWKFHQGMSIDSEGLNPFLEGSSAFEKESARILSQAVAKSKLQFISFTNSHEISVGDTQSKKIGECTFTPTTETNALFVATILVDIDVADTEETDTEEVQVPVTPYYNEQETVVTDINGNPVTLLGTATNTMTYKRDGKCDVEVFYRLNGIMIPSDESPYIATDCIEKGKHIITVSYPITSLVAYQRFEFEVWITSKGGTTVVPARTLRATLFGQELTDTTKFDGRLKVEDTMDMLAHIEKLGIITITDDAEITFVNSAFASVSDDISLYNISSVERIPIEEGTGELSPHLFLMGGKYIMTDSGAYLTTDNGKRLITDKGDTTEPEEE